MQKDPDEIIIPLFNAFKFLKGQMKRASSVVLNISELGALHYISKKGRVSMKELSEFLEITPPSTTALIDKMIEMNILERSFNEDDRRNVILSFSKGGEAIFKKVKAEKVKIIEDIISGLSEKEQLDLKNILRKLFKKIV